MASSSSSHQRNQELNAFPGSGKIREVCESSRLFDVFINHRGPDVKTTLATQLYKSLEQLGIRAFLDSEEKELGTSFPSTIHTAILSAKVHVAIFSKTYAESAWCLAELVLMLQSNAKIIPVFYEVEPWELRHIEKGVYAKAFVNHEEKGRYHEEKLKEWKEALHSLSFTAGEVFKSFSDWDCQKIVPAVQTELQKKTYLHVAEHPVGLNILVEDFERGCLDELVKDFENQCKLEERKDKAKIVGIFGMGGLGKTTLAKELYNRKKSSYSRVSFLFDAREASVKRKLHRLQRQLLKDLFDKEPSFKSTEEGISHLKDHLERKPHLSFLIVVDDIDHVEQLNALRVKDILDRSCNSLVIVTTRDAGVLITAGITVGYNLKVMNRNCGRELFCWHAFSQPHPYKGYEEMVDDFLEVCRGLPLSLLVLGQHVHGRDHRFWESELIKARKMQPQDVKKRLRISFDALDDEEKQVFIDVACFFLDRPRSIAEKILEVSGWNAHNAIETLKDKCLIDKEELWSYEGPVLRMHDHLRDLGRELAVELSPPHRLWRPQDLELMGFKTILARTDVRCFHSIFDESMGSRVTFFMGKSNDFFETSGSLLWLQLEGNSTEQPSIPSWIPLQNLQYLEIKGGQLKTLWENSIQAPSQLKELQISETSLKEFPDLLGISKDSLENGVDSSSVKAPMSGLEKLEIEIRGEKFVSKILISGIDYPGLKSIKLHGMENLMEVSLASVKTLNRLDIKNCKKLERLTVTSDLTNLVLLNISECPELKQPSLGHLSCLEGIRIEDCEHLKSVSGISNLKKLVILIISNCWKLEFESLHLRGMNCLNSIEFGVDVKVKYFELEGCQFLKTLEFGCEELVELIIRGCPKLKTLPYFIGASCLERIIIDGCEIRELQFDGCQNLRSVSGNFGLTRLIIRDCPELEELPSVAKVSEEIVIESCQKLQNISGNFELGSLIIRECPELEELPSVANVRWKIVIDSCEKLQNISGIEEMHAPGAIRLSYCSNAVIRSCIHKLKSVPRWRMEMIGRAADGAESSFNENLFFDAHIGADAVKDAFTDEDWGYGEYGYAKHVFVYHIGCFLVVVDSSTSVEDINNDLLEEYKHYPYLEYDQYLGECSLKVREGEWIITMMVTCSDTYIELDPSYRYVKKVSDLLRGKGIMKEEFWVKLNEGEEGKFVGVLKTIVDKLHYL